MRTSTSPLSIVVTRRGNVGPGAARAARAKVASVLEDVREPILDVHVVLDWYHDPARSRPALAEVNVDLNGRHVRAMSVATTMRDALDEVAQRLRRRIRSWENRERARHRQAHATHQRGDGGEPSRRQPPHVQRAADEREIVRYKVHPDVPLSPADASYERELLDHDFYLFHNSETGAPALLRLVDPHSYAVDDLPATLTEAQARTRLDAGGEPLVFYVDRDTGEARVLYVRYDGHLGLITLGA